MTNVETDMQINNPTSIKPIDVEKGPLVEICSDADFMRYVPTGITLRLDVPLAKNSSNYIAAVNVDGLLFNFWQVAPLVYGTLLANLFPVQLHSALVGHGVVEWEMVAHPIYSMMQSHRYMAGNVRIGVRLTTNVGQTGNLIVSQGNNLMRYYYEADTTNTYHGVRFINASDKVLDYASSNFLVGDVSLNRNFSITPSQANPNRVLDIMQKVHVLSTLPPRTSNNSLYHAAVATHFSEDWIFISTLTNLPATNGNQLFMTFFFDYSNVIFEEKCRPIISFIPPDINKQILLYSMALDGVAPITLDKTLIPFLPGDALEMNMIKRRHSLRIKKQRDHEEDLDLRDLTDLLNKIKLNRNNE